MSKAGGCEGGGALCNSGGGGGGGVAVLLGLEPVIAVAEPIFEGVPDEEDVTL